MASISISVAARRAPFGFCISYPTIFKCIPRLAAVGRFSSTFSSVGAVPIPGNELLRRALQDEIKDHREEAEKEIYVPESFPFKIIDILDEDIITLKRNVYGEDIEVEIKWPDWFEHKELEERNGKSFFLKITIDKKENTYLKINCFLYEKKILLHYIHLKSHKVSDDSEDDSEEYEGPRSIDKEFQRAVLKYLKARGIDCSLLEFVEKYWRNKRAREYFQWLKNTTNFMMP